MEPKKFGRTLGIGVRVASNIARDRAARAAADGKKRESAVPATAYAPRMQEETAARMSAKGNAIGRGAKNFTQSVLVPFKHAGGVLWLEITGVFFAFFTFFFVQSAFRVHSAWRAGAEHSHFLLYIVLSVVFGWFATSSFLRARRREKRAQR